MDNALLEYRKSSWFHYQKQSPRKYLPASCATFEYKLNFIAIKTYKNFLTSKFNVEKKKTESWSPNQKKQIPLIINSRNHEKNGCFEHIRQKILHFFTALAISTFICTVAQLTQAFCLLLKSLQLNDSSESKSKLFTSNSSDMENL